MIAKDQKKTKDLAVAEEAAELSWIANAYLNCAIRLCESLLDDEYDKSIHHFRVPLHLAYLAVELYLKAGISLAGHRYHRTHDLNKLHQQYDDAGMGIKLPIPSYLDRLTPRSADLFTEHPSPPSSWHFERFRYFSDKKGTPFPDLDLADLQELKDELEELHVAGLSVLSLVLKAAD